jgi:hypothetical protein
VQYAEDSGIQIVFLSQQRLFPFAHWEIVPPLTVEDVQNIIQLAFPEAVENISKESEILQKIVEGNMLILEKIFNDMQLGENGTEFDLTPFLDKNYDPLNIF